MSRIKTRSRQLFNESGKTKLRTNKEDQSEYQARHIQKLSIWNFDTGMAYRQRRLSNQLRIPVQVNDAAAGNRPDRRHGLEISQVYQRKTRSNCIQSTDHLQLSEILRHAKDIPTDLDLLISWVRTDERDNKWWQAPQNIGSPRTPAVTLDTPEITIYQENLATRRRLVFDEEKLIILEGLKKTIIKWFTNWYPVRNEMFTKTDITLWANVAKDISKKWNRCKPCKNLVWMSYLMYPSLRKVTILY